MSAVIRLFGVVMALAYFGLVVHEATTGAEYIRGVAMKLMVTHEMTMLPAMGLAGLIVLGAPCIALMGLLGFTKK
ncbi:TPA: hypothetical protein DIS57_00090 [Candidatus Wolfebacteria bacterium]|nr:hypothetical protein [Candidatus Wolfebacteria bacterium]